MRSRRMLILEVQKRRLRQVSSVTVEKERKIFNMDPFEADPSPVMPSITFAESSSVQPDSQGTEAVVSSQGIVGKKRKLAHTAIPGHEQASESLSAGVSSRGGNIVECHKSY